MAQGKLSPRQRMINLMYLIFIAMLALNMSKEVLTAFGLINEKYTSQNAKLLGNVDLFYEDLATKAEESPARFAELNEKAIQMKSLSEGYYRYLDSLKGFLVETVKDTSDYEVMDKTDRLDQAFFQGDRYSPAGSRFVSMMVNYREGLKALVADSYPDLIDEIDQRFGTGNEKGKVTNRDGLEVDWLDYHYQGFPLIASLTKMTGIQNDILSTEEDVLNSMLQNQLTRDASMTNYSTLLLQPKGAWYQGETFTGSVVLGRTDEKTVPTEVNLLLDGRKLRDNEFTIEKGRVVLNVGAGNAGDHAITGELVFLEKGERISVPVEQTFATIAKPNAAVISADKMNVVYRGVDNPMTISVPGVADNKVSAAAPGLSQLSGSKYVMRPKGGTEVTIVANFTLPGGAKESTKSTFRIKDIPKPAGSIRSEIGEARMSKQNLAISTVGAVLEDFDFDLKLVVRSFKFKVPGEPTVQVTGTGLDEAAKRALSRAKRGDTVTLFDIQAEIVNNSSYKLPKVTPVLVEITN